MISFDNELERLIDSDFLINPQLEGHALAKLTKVIRSQDRHKFDIALFWAQIPRTICHNTRVAQMHSVAQISWHRSVSEEKYQDGVFPPPGILPIGIILHCVSARSC